MRLARRFPLVFLALMQLLPACSLDEGAAAVETDAWIGQWIGPEGTFLRLEGGAGKYTITIQNLDGPMTYQGISVADRIEFHRNGRTEVLHATNGVDTGMKWLSDKTVCLTVRPGEGYCR